ncbi:MAG: cupin domain-containing protein [Gemmatimonadota bacterium]
MNLSKLAAGIREAHEHVPLADVNDHRVILAVNEKPYPWHEHPNSDELFLVVEGILRLELADGKRVDLQPLDTYLVPGGTVHRTIPLGRCVNLVFQRAGTETRFAEEAES